MLPIWDTDLTTRHAQHHSGSFDYNDSSNLDGYQSVYQEIAHLHTLLYIFPHSHYLRDIVDYQLL